MLPPRPTWLPSLAPGLSQAGLAIVIFVILLAAALPAWRDAHYFHPAQDPLWAGLLAQLIHLNLAHAAINLAGLLCLALAARFLDHLPQVLPALLASGVAVCLGLQLESPPIAWYAGLSGALYGSWGWLCLEIATSRRARPGLKGLAGLACLAIGSKAALGIGSTGVLADLPIARQAHLYGYAGGLVFAVSLIAGRYWRRRVLARTA